MVVAGRSITRGCKHELSTGLDLFKEVPRMEMGDLQGLGSKVKSAVRATR